MIAKEGSMQSYSFHFLFENEWSSLWAGIVGKTPHQNTIVVGCADKPFSI